MKRKVIIFAVISAIIGIIIGLVAGLTIKSIKSDDLTGTAFSLPTREKTVVEEADFYYADDNGKPDGEKIGKYIKYTHTDVLDKPDGSTFEKFVSYKVKYSFPYLKDNEFINVQVYTVKTFSDGSKSISEEAKEFCVTKENSGISITYSPQTIQYFNDDGSPQGEYIEYFIKCDNRDIALGDITSRIQ